MSQGQLVQPHTSIYHTVTAGVVTARGLPLTMEKLTRETMLFTQHQGSLSHSGSSCDARKELAGTLSWKMILLTQHQRKASFACTYALPSSCLDAFCILLLAALVIDAVYPHPVLCLCCLLCCPCCSAGLPCQECGRHCASFCDYFTTVPCKDPA